MNQWSSDFGHLKLWLVETPADGERWREVPCKEDNKQFSVCNFTGTFTVAGSAEHRFIGC
jgi:hypothetical protein